MKLPLGGIADAFADRNFRLYSIGSIVSWLSFFVQAVAVAWTAWDLTHSAEWLAIVALADAIPNILLIPIGGVVADRMNRFRVMLLAYAVATLQAALLAGFSLSGHLTIGSLTILAALHGSAHAFSIPASYGLMPRFIVPERLPAAIAVAAAYQQLGLFVGPALAGWVIGTFGTGIAFASNVVGYGIFFACVVLMRTPAGYRAPQPSGKAFIADFRDGLGAIMHNTGLVSLLALMLFGDMLATSVRQMAPAFSATYLGAGVNGLATLLAAGGIGATLAALWLAQGGSKRIIPQTILLAFLGFLVAVTVLMLSEHLVFASVAMIGIGAFYEVCRTGAVALLQISVPDSMRGRVMSTQFLILRLSGSLGVAIVGASAPAFGLRLPILAIVAVSIVVWALTFARRNRVIAAFAARSEM
jgi:MFS family permease